MSASEMADWMLRLQDEGRCHNINFVTPEHVGELRHARGGKHRGMAREDMLVGYLWQKWIRQLPYGHDQGAYIRA